MRRDFRKSVSAASKKPVPSLQFETGVVFENFAPQIWNVQIWVIDFQKPRPSKRKSCAQKEQVEQSQFPLLPQTHAEKREKLYGSLP